MNQATVEIVNNGRGGSVIYTEGEHRIDFSFEFAMLPAIALVFGPGIGAFEREGAWAAGRRAEIYDTVGRELVPQQAPGGAFSVDLASGIIEILKRPP
jgi:hypothetical protein